MTTTTTTSATKPSSGVGFDTQIQLGGTRIPYSMRDGADAAQLGRRLRQMDPDRVVLVVDDALRRRPEVEQLRQAFDDAAPGGCRLLSVQASEQAKTLTTVSRLLEDMVAAGATHDTVMVVVGGGLVSNVAGLAALLLYRGAIRMVEVPTTLLAMVDISGLSLKRGVNLITDTVSVKNAVGQFFPSTLVWVDLAWLHGLPRGQIRSGLCEVIKNVLAIRADRHDEVARLLTKDATYTSSDYQRFIELGIEANTEVMADDPREETRGLTRTYGHKVGHALQLVTNGRLPHGLAVGIGMHAAARVAARRGLLSQGDVEVHTDLLERNGAPTRLPASVTPQDVLRGLRYPNTRRLRAGAEELEPAAPRRHSMVLLEGIGRPRYDPEEQRPLTRVDDADLAAVLHDLAA